MDVQSTPDSGGLIHPMKIVFRADASLQMGIGHMMRCLTLAGALRQHGAECHFICREHPGHMIGHCRDQGFTTHVLPCPADGAIISGKDGEPLLAHAAWLGTSQEHDAEECAPILASLQPDWLIADHYALDANWERLLKPHYRRLMIIDDLADRRHCCQLLLDQTFDRTPNAYRPWVPRDCKLLCGSRYALLRTEFRILRPYSLARRNSSMLRHLLISMGGTDIDNATGHVLQALQSSELPSDCTVTIVMGAGARRLKEVRQQAEDSRWPTQVKVDVREMAQLMADSDLAIGAAGTSSWERCCLGLPSIVVALAENQLEIARTLKSVGAIRLTDLANLPAELHNLLTEQQKGLLPLSRLTAAMTSIVDGHGAIRAASQLLADH